MTDKRGFLGRDALRLRASTGRISGLATLVVVLVVAARVGCSPQSPATPEPRDVAARDSTSVAPDANSSGQSETSLLSTEDVKVSVMQEQSETRKFAYVMFQFQKMMICGKAHAKRKLKLTDNLQSELEPFCDEAQKSWLMVQSKSIPADDFFPRFLPRAVEFEEAVKSKLNSTQRSELLRLVLGEHEGAIVFLFPDVAENLQLSPTQLETVEGLVDDTASKFDWNNLSVFDLLKLKQLSAENRKAALKLLSEEQRKNWKSLVSGKDSPLDRFRPN